MGPERASQSLPAAQAPSPFHVNPHVTRILLVVSILLCVVNFLYYQLPLLLRLGRGEVEAPQQHPHPVQVITPIAFEIDAVELMVELRERYQNPSLVLSLVPIEYWAVVIDQHPSVNVIWLHGILLQGPLDYILDEPLVGSAREWMGMRETLLTLGMRVMVSVHIAYTAPSSPWIRSHPHYYISPPNGGTDGSGLNGNGKATGGEKEDCNPKECYRGGDGTSFYYARDINHRVKAGGCLALNYWSSDTRAAVVEAMKGLAALSDYIV